MGNKSSKQSATNAKSKGPVLASNFKAKRKEYIKQEIAYHELIVFGYLRQCAGRRDMSIHYDLMRHITTWYRPTFEFTKWSSRHGMIECFNVDDDGKTMVRRYSRYYGTNPVYILAHYSNLVHTGVHCWRFFVKMDSTERPNNNVLFAISTTKRFTSHDMGNGWSTNKENGEIFAVNNNIYRYCRYNKDMVAGEFNLNTNYDNERYEYEVDILLDCDNNIMRACIVGELNDEQEYVIWNLPQHNKGWIPHIQTTYVGLQLRIAKMSAKWYGIKYTDKYQK